VQQCCLSTITPGKVQTNFAQLLLVGAIFNQGLSVIVVVNIDRIELGVECDCGGQY
jgi:hypothetical protein